MSLILFFSFLSGSHFLRIDFPDIRSVSYPGFCPFLGIKKERDREKGTEGGWGGGAGTSFKVFFSPNNMDACLARRVVIFKEGLICLG